MILKECSKSQKSQKRTPQLKKKKKVVKFGYGRLICLSNVIQKMASRLTKNEDQPQQALRFDLHIFLKCFEGIHCFNLISKEFHKVGRHAPMAQSENISFHL